MKHIFLITILIFISGAVKPSDISSWIGWKLTDKRRDMCAPTNINFNVSGNSLKILSPDNKLTVRALNNTYTSNNTQIIATGSNKNHILIVGEPGCEIGMLVFSPIGGKGHVVMPPPGVDPL